jgi:hypothetical protein
MRFCDFLESGRVLGVFGWLFCLLDFGLLMIISIFVSFAYADYRMAGHAMCRFRHAQTSSISLGFWACLLETKDID